MYCPKQFSFLNCGKSALLEGSSTCRLGFFSMVTQAPGKEAVSKAFYLKAVIKHLKKH
jgi:hypothetical protein